MGKIVRFSEIVESNGKTIRENNLKKEHQICIGSLVEVKYDNWYGNGACSKRCDRLFVVEHTRDCDGTPLYTLASSNEYLTNNQDSFFTKCAIYKTEHGFSEETLTVIELTDAIKRGDGALCWDKE